LIVSLSVIQSVGSARRDPRDEGCILADSTRSICQEIEHSCSSAKTSPATSRGVSSEPNLGSLALVTTEAGNRQQHRCVGIVRHPGTKRALISGPSSPVNGIVRHRTACVYRLPVNSCRIDACKLAGWTSFLI
jgi:hypothetical protein